MEGDKIYIREEYSELGSKLADAVLTRKDLLQTDRFSITVAGESGCGKSVTARVLADQLVARNLACQVISQDDYFSLPPRTNHEKRLADFDHIGPQEVDLKRLQLHLQDFHAGAEKIVTPLVYYSENRICEQEISLKNVDVLLIEGTYVSLLEEVSMKLFLEHTYLETLAQRQQRNRGDELSAFNERVLAREHEIISTHAAQADLLINSDYEISLIR